jgi:dynein heavy chain
VYINFSA